MQFELVETVGDSKAIYHVKKASVAGVNALRRAVISRIPSFAIDQVDFYENNSALFNEYLANRIGLIPLTFDDSSADDARISLSLNATGPGIVTTKDLVSTDTAIMPLNEDFPIMDLGENQHLRFEAWAVKGIAQKHAKFQCALASYSYYPKYTLKKGPKAKEFLDSLPRSFFSAKGELKPFAAVDVVEEFIAKNPEQGDFKYENDEFLFMIDSFNNVTAATHLKTALAVLKSEAAEALKQVK